ncbi:endonuclease [Vibrio sp. D431a]|uniref:endonuclease n=1 Tax=Vibrio sp. D431a TaxID=2837388 RepID=UPI00255375CE|nr:endonuclease [Vibrio sp. D431a]MDK9790012.1 endonuclease [Vibrio sp. D431a]
MKTYILLGAALSTLTFSTSTLASTPFFLARSISGTVSEIQSSIDPTPPKNFSDAKAWLSKITLKYHPFAFYSGCKLKTSGRSIRIDLHSCNYKVRKDLKRASRGEAEHILPISWVYRGMECSNGKSSREARSYCQRTSNEFNRAEGDLVNLQYAVGEINGDRAHFKYAKLESGFDYGLAGKIYFDETGRRFMPPKEKWGWIGRVHLYMADKYPVRYSKSYRRLMESWSMLEPTKWECDYNNLLKRDFNVENPYTTRICF